MLEVSRARLWVLGLGLVVYPLLFGGTKPGGNSLAFHVLGVGSLGAALAMSVGQSWSLGRRDRVILACGGVAVLYGCTLLLVTFGPSLGVVLLAVLPGFLWLQLKTPADVTREMPAWTYWSVVVLLLAATLSSFLTFHQQVALAGNPIRYTGYVSLLACIVIFLATVRWARTGNPVPLLLGALTVSAVVVSAIAMWQFFDNESARRLFPDLGVDTRPLGTLGHPNWFGTFLCLTFPLCVTLYLRQQRLAGRAAFLLGSGLLFAALLVCQTRGAYLGVTAFLVFLGVTQSGRWRALLPLILTLCAVAVVILPAKEGEVAQRILSFGNEVDRASELSRSAGTGRFGMWMYAIRHIPPHLLVGSGMDTYAEVAPDDDPPPPRTDKAHSIYFEYALTLGLPGLLAYLSLVVSCVSAPVRGDLLAWGFRGAVLAYLVQGVFIHDTIQVWPVLWVILGLAVARHAGRSTGEVFTPPSARDTRR